MFFLSSNMDNWNFKHAVVSTDEYINYSIMATKRSARWIGDTGLFTYCEGTTDIVRSLFGNFGIITFGDDSWHVSVLPSKPLTNPNDDVSHANHIQFRSSADEDHEIVLKVLQVTEAEVVLLFNYIVRQQTDWLGDRVMSQSWSSSFKITWHKRCLLGCKLPAVFPTQLICR